MRSMSHQPLLTREMNNSKLTVSIYPYFFTKIHKNPLIFKGLPLLKEGNIPIIQTCIFGLPWFSTSRWHRHPLQP